MEDAESARNKCWSPELQAATIADMTLRFTRMFPGVVTPNWRADAEALILLAYQTADIHFGLKEAADWGNMVPRWGGVGEHIVEADEAMIRASGMSLERAASVKMGPDLPNRLSAERVHRLLPNNPERNKLLSIARGVPVVVPPGFVPNGSGGEIPALRRKYVMGAPAVNRSNYEAYIRKSRALLVSKPFAERYLMGEEALKPLQLSPLGWAASKKVAGRPTTDCSDGGSQPGNLPLNSVWTKEQCDVMWGKITHPTIETFARMVLQFFRRVNEDAHAAGQPPVQWSDIVLWKMDICGAYNLISFRPEDVHLLASETDDEKIIIFLVGTFGWCGTPAAFHVVTRAIVFELKARLTGDAEMYVDDVGGVCLRHDLAADMATAQKVIEGLLGPGSLAEDKTETSDQHDGSLTLIGYTLDLTRALVTVSERNILKAVYEFLAVNYEATVPVKTMERLASLGSRYSGICLYLRPFTRALYNAYKGHGQHISVRLLADARRAIRVFRLFLILTAVDARRFARSLVSFDLRPSGLIVEFDACLTGIGVIWYYRYPDGREICLGFFARNLHALNFGVDSSFQNICEFFAVTLGIVGLELLTLPEDVAVQSGTVELRGDSMSALVWASEERYKSDLVGNAAVAYTLTCVSREIRPGQMTHLSAEENWRTDDLSRVGRQALESMIARDPALAILRDKWVDIPRVEEWVSLFNPRRKFGQDEEDEEFLQFWAHLRELIQPTIR